MSEAAGQAARSQWPVLAGAVALALGRERLRSAFTGPGLMCVRLMLIAEVHQRLLYGI
jgi:hypothetical protein